MKKKKTNKKIKNNNIIVLNKKENLENVYFDTSKINEKLDIKTEYKENLNITQEFKNSTHDMPKEKISVEEEKKESSFEEEINSNKEKVKKEKIKILNLNSKYRKNHLNINLKEDEDLINKDISQDCNKDIEDEIIKINEGIFVNKLEENINYDNTLHKIYKKYNNNSDNITYKCIYNRKEKPKEIPNILVLFAMDY